MLGFSWGKEKQAARGTGVGGGCERASEWSRMEPESHMCYLWDFRGVSGLL